MENMFTTLEHYNGEHVYNFRTLMENMFTTLEHYNACGFINITNDSDLVRTIDTSDCLLYNWLSFESAFSCTFLAPEVTKHSLLLYPTPPQLKFLCGI